MSANLTEHQMDLDDTVELPVLVDVAMLEPVPHDAADAAEPISAPALISLDSKLCLRLPLSQPVMTIGRGPDCDIQIVTDVVSRKHASICWDSGSAVIEDHASVNGVYVNGKRVSSAELKAGDEVRIGEARFRFETRLPATD